MRKLLVTALTLFAALVVAVGAIFAQESSATTESAWIGIAIADQDEQVVITRVQSGSPAAAADLLIGDVITSFNGTEVASASELSALVQAAAPGDTATLEIVRNDETVSVDVTLGSRPTRTRGGRGFGNLSELDVISVAERLLTADLEEAENGFAVVDVFSLRNPFALAAGDVVTSINGQNVTELDLAALADNLRSMATPEISVVVVRDGEEVTLTSQEIGGRFGFGGRGPGRHGGHRGGNFDNNDLAPDATEEAPETTPTPQGQA